MRKNKRSPPQAAGFVRDEQRSPQDLISAGGQVTEALGWLALLRISGVGMDWGFVGVVYRIIFRPSCGTLRTVHLMGIR